MLTRVPEKSRIWKLLGSRNPFKEHSGITIPLSLAVSAVILYLKKKSKTEKSLCVNLFLWIISQRHEIKTCLMFSFMRRVKLHATEVDMRKFRK